jgi:hypothetical protein
MLMLDRTPVLFIQGGGEGVHDEWDARMVDSLSHALGAGYEVRYPRMPSEADPSYAGWAPVITGEIAALSDGAIVVGHSVGATVMINVLAENPPKPTVDVIVLLAAPFVGAGGWPRDEFELPPDLGQRLPRGVPVLLFHGLEDGTVPPSHAELYAQAIPHARVHRLPGRDHQLNDDLSEVADEIKRPTRP